ncbi:putative aerolysin, Agglutinin domain, aerolysin-like toxin, beta complex domain-containing protein [Rosa chinensis]|uniref:Putative aerolysin, Agglutinin domain, aerolysin-like toxin, beta complex domain-containing protein n=1 Tax=Rosa chinensis TaxID=74649 RepID=A0A2P6QKP7_ROSCH|nr:uncharacterized protein LOC112164145 [Rosa chinensis]PRQ34746.1 putative aerolysin, Agglutinin domain, aerolysin-like toxin, beta complex domain-containing protein [Rosa chinensis]
MSVLLPPTIAIKTGWGNANVYMNYNDDSNSQTRGFLKFNGGNVFSPLAKFEVVAANTGIGMVHLRCSHNKKFLRVRAQGGGYISPDADEPEEDQSKWSCTLFQPRPVDGNPDRVRLFHVQLQKYPVFDNTYYFWVGYNNPAQQDILEIIDLESLVILPRHVAFKGHNGKYLGTIELNNQRYLAFDYAAKGRPETWFEVSTDGHGRAQIMSNHTKTFWRNAGTTNWIWSDVESANDLTTHSNFWPVKVNNNTIALNSSTNNNFCSLIALNSTTDCLNAAYSSIAPESHLVMEELVLSRSIYNADFDLANAIIYGETPVTMATANASNNTDAENTVEFKFAYVESKSSTWSTSHSWMAGVSVTASFKIPFIGGTEVTATAEYSGSYEWGETITTENTLETTYSVVVLPRTSISVSLVATKGSCDVPYSYYQRDVLYNGKTVVYKKDDGLYTGINSYNFRYEATTLTQARSDTPATLVQKLPDPLTDPSIEQKVPLPFPSAEAQISQLFSSSEEIAQEPNLPDVAQQLEETTEMHKSSLSPRV